MLTKEVSQNYFNNALISIHATRRNSLFESCWALINRADLTVTSLGRHRGGNAYDKHKIKASDRLIGNPILHAEIQQIYKEFFQPYMASSNLIIIVDWSGCCRDDFHMLRASVMQNGRSISIYNEIHPQKKLGNPEVQRDFLKNLYKQIPFGKQVIIITDAGFATPWFKAVLKLGWNFIGRMKSDIKLLFDGHSRWMKTKNLHRKAKAKPRYEGGAVIGKKSGGLKGEVYSLKIKNKKRKDKSKYPDVNDQYSKANKTPWILVTSLNNKKYGKKTIIEIYQNRMQIEENFRDEKDPRFGFGWRYARSSCPKRMAVLCLIANIAAFFLYHLGLLAERLQLQRRYQVNTVRNRRVLSLLTLAKLIIKDRAPRELIELFRRTINQLLQNNEVLYG